MAQRSSARRKPMTAPAAPRPLRVTRLLDEAQALMSGGRALLALPLLEQARELAPLDAEPARLLAVRAVLLEDASSAVGQARNALTLAPERADLWMVLGRAHKLAGALDDAVEAYRHAVNLDPELAEAHVSLGIAFKNRGLLSDAVACYRRALALNPQLAAAHANLGNALILQSEQLASGASAADTDADAAQRRAVELDPNNALARANWARTLDRRGQTEKAIDLLNQALALDPANEDLCNALAAALHKLRWFEAARDVLDRWLRSHTPRRAATVNSMATTLLHLDRFSDALAWARKAERQGPDEPDILYNIGCVLTQRLQVREALDYLRRIVQFAPHYHVARETLVLSQNYIETDPAAVLREHRAFGAAIERPAPADAPALAPLVADKPRLRLAYLSGDLRRHSVAYFMEPLLEAHDHARFEVWAYHNSRHFDEVSERLKAHCDHWVPCAALSDDALLRRIRSDAIDILIDLSGTTADARPEVLAQRAAPLQIVYLGYPTTTGIAAMDFRITDAAIDPPGHEAHSTETLLRCERSMFCYRPDSEAGVGEPPHRRNGFITFGSFNNLPKLSDDTLALWAAVLKAVPRSKLLLKTKALADAEVQQIVRERFAAHGIGSERLLLNPWRPDLRSHLEVYREIDIALDTFPYNGATTSCEALWAGVPVLTLCGQTHTSRMGASILGAIGRPQWVATSAEGFVECAARLAGDADALASFRAGAREQMRASALMDGAGFARGFEALLFEAWRSRCQTRSDDPVQAAAALARGHAQAQAGRHEQALDAYRSALALAPNDLQAHWGVARTLANLTRVDEAVPALQHLVGLDPQAAAAWFLLGGMHEYQGRVDDSRRAYDRALALAPSDAVRICRDLLLPSIVPHGCSLPALRAEHAATLRALIASQPRLDDPLQQLSSGPVNQYFRLAYHGLGNRELHELHAALQLAACPGLAWVAPHCRAGAQRRTRDGRLRIGFISRFFRQHSIGKTSVGLIEQLSRRHFHVSVLFISPRRDDAMARRIADAADAVLELPADLAASREAIAALELDILFYQDIGMEPHSYYLAFARLAPLQCVSFGHPDTTGIPNMDAWVSAEAYEAAGADAHYSEQLVRIPEVGTLAFYDRPVLRPEDTVSRAGFGLPDGVPLLVCPQGLFKIHPEMDELLAAALARLPDARLLLVQGDVPAYREQLVARWRARGDGIERAAVFFPPLEHASFLSLFALADVVLDTVHFNGMNSSLEALALGAPVVTLPKHYQRGRHTQAMYQRIGFIELVARDEAHYVDLVVRLARDADWRAQVRERILARCGALFRDAAVVRGFERALIELMPRVAATATERADA